MGHCKSFHFYSEPHGVAGFLGELDVVIREIGIGDTFEVLDLNNWKLAGAVVRNGRHCRESKFRGVGSGDQEPRVDVTFTGMSETEGGASGWGRGA